MARLSRAKINQIKQIIKDYMSIVASVTVGGTKPPDNLLKKLKLSKPAQDLIEASYKYGKLRIISEKDITANLTTSDVDKLIAGVKLTPVQRYAMETSQIKAQQYIDSLTQRVTANTLSVILQSDIAMWEAVKDTIPRALQTHMSVGEVAATLRDSTKDMFRDWNRVAHTEMWGAKCKGEADAILAGESPLSKDKENTVVYMKPDGQACPSCRRIYLERDKVTPKTFTLAELIANGNNYGKKQADWVPCIPPLHPNCHCTINVKPKDTAFDAQGNLIYQPDSK